ncbi:N-acetyltransferase eco isoform X2 [Anopheles bellator]|uniref:N-acetyltransferase eco isoform X2 n=1 Tax=Anopheles bellator TaxID=139047 RepID=UPI00264A160B|nr:N-acetyltransferase eco isoform X2 [Anopheles bellator]
METPKSLDKGVQREHAASSKLASLKKALFGKDDCEDSDLGPMTPLRFGSKRKGPKKPHTPLSNINSFRNLFGNESPESDRSLSPDFLLRFTNNGRYELVPESENQHNVDEETRFSFHNIPETPSSHRVSTEENALLDENNSNSLSKMMNSDLNLVDKRTKPLLRTPGVTSRSSESKPVAAKSQGLSLRRTHHHAPKPQFVTASYATTSISLSPSPEPSNADSEKENESPPRRSSNKARISLQFNDIQPIPTKSFYSSVADKRPKTPIPVVLVSPEADEPDRKDKTPPTTKTPHKSTMRKRSKSFSSTAPRLGQRGVCHKIRKPSKKPLVKGEPDSENKTEPHSKKRSKSEKKGAKIAKSCPTTPKSCGDEESECSDGTDVRRRLKRVAEILRHGQDNLKRVRPLSTARSMTDLSALSAGEEAHSSSSSEEEDSALESQQNRKFFRSADRKRSSRKVYNHLNSIKFTVRGGKRKLSSFPEAPKRPRMEFSMSEDFDFDLEQLEVEDLINRLDNSNSNYVEPFKSDSHNGQPGAEDDTSNDEPIPIQPNVIYIPAHELTSDMEDEEPLYDQASDSIFVHGHLSAAGLSEDVINAMAVDNACDIGDEVYEHTNNTNTGPGSVAKNEYYPIFYKERVRELWKSRQAEELQPHDLYHLIRETPNGKRKRYGIGHDQYQIDAGQRSYGARKCIECGLVYSHNEPEEELIHDNFHRSLAKLTFGGWTSEHIVTPVPEWDVTGRIIVVSQSDSKQWLTKVQHILEVVDSELGYATNGQLPDGAFVYLAVARSIVLGICVVQSLQFANRMVSLDGLHGAPIDCYSSEFYPAKCGVSRIWVSPKYRRLGVGARLIDAIRGHYIFGYLLKIDDIAFGAPTESGKLFAEAVTGRKDFLVYI